MSILTWLRMQISAQSSAYLAYVNVHFILVAYADQCPVLRVPGLREYPFYLGRVCRSVPSPLPT